MYLVYQVFLVKNLRIQSTKLQKVTRWPISRVLYKSSMQVYILRLRPPLMTYGDYLSSLAVAN